MHNNSTLNFISIIYNMSFGRFIQDTKPLRCTGINMVGNKITNLADPTAGTDGVTKNYADTLSSNLTYGVPTLNTSVTGGIVIGGTGGSVYVKVDNLVTIYVKYNTLTISGGNLSFEVEVTDFTIDQVINGHFTAVGSNIALGTAATKTGNSILVNGFGLSADGPNDACLTATFTVL